MSGHVFHPGHDDLHGVTVIVATTGGKTLVGRWHEQGPRGVYLHDVAVHEGGADQLPISEWLGKLRKFGVNVAHRNVVVPNEEFVSVQRFDEP